MPEKRRLVTSKVCFGSEKAGLLDHSYNKCALEKRVRGKEILERLGSARFFYNSNFHARVSNLVQTEKGGRF